MKKKHFIYLSLIFTFLLGTHNGYVTLWENGKPMWVTPCPVSMLPSADQAALKDGIVINSMDDLNRLLEDYLS
mgnify:CR=1 FL=1